MGHIYHNCYRMMEEVRHGINEYSSGLVNGTETHGKFTNAYILDKINAAQRHMWNALMLRIPDEFLAEENITVTSSVITLPWRFGRIVQLETNDKHKVYRSTVKAKPVDGSTGSKRLYYRKGRTLVLNQDSVNDTYYIKYYYRPRDIHFGQAQASSGATSLRMDSTYAAPKDDYYNDMIVENYTAAFEDTVSDYAKTNYVATTAAETWTEDDWYGVVPEIPEEFHFLIPALATILVKSQHPASQELPSKDEIDRFAFMFTTAIQGFAGNEEDVNPEQLWCDFDAPSPGWGFTIPSQGYTIY